MSDFPGATDDFVDESRVWVDQNDHKVRALVLEPLGITAVFLLHATHAKVYCSCCYCRRNMLSLYSTYH